MPALRTADARPDDDTGAAIKVRGLSKRFGDVEAVAGIDSEGMKRKLTIAAGIIHSPAILFMDEPSARLRREHTEG